MNRKDILRLAQESGAMQWCKVDQYKKLERFAALVVAANKPETAIAEAYRCGWKAGAIATRDVCIALCEEHWRNGGNLIECADAIRAKGEK